MHLKSFKSRLFLGRQFDKQGNLKQWWNNRTIAEFRKAAECIVQQYSNYTLDEINLAIDGRLTQGENIADNGGLKQAFRVIIQKKSAQFLEIFVRKIIRKKLKKKKIANFFVNN